MRVGKNPIKKQIGYMAVTADEYELPLSQMELYQHILEDKYGLPHGTVSAAICRGRDVVLRDRFSKSSVNAIRFVEVKLMDLVDEREVVCV